MLSSQATGRPVISLVSAETLATVTGYVIAPAPARIAALTLKSHGSGNLVTWNHIHAFGPDAVTVRAPDKLQDGKEAPQPLAGHLNDPIGKRILTEAGQDLGTLEDIDFDETTGHIHRLITADREIPGEHLLGAGGYAVVIAAP
ncbi:PRC-barrel domain protein [Streptomyces sp. ADI95-16]|uniref:PRC-barrel domain-containing protein n=1 Tax=Streptomyces sp. ADI95-16 TaxID=1522758 RepID=UPI000F3AA021|nr:PRC-barrel domain-containing protein [Streptomyces sp. ADI95-16]AYV26462.1 PRC-barrel domain protein [Streptomyces sp. ADI95-16]